MIVAMNQTALMSETSNALPNDTVVRTLRPIYSNDGYEIPINTQGVIERVIPGTDPIQYKIKWEFTQNGQSVTKYSQSEVGDQWVDIAETP